MQQNLSIKVALGATNKLSGPLNAAREASRGLASSIKSTQDNLKGLDRQAKKFDRATSAVKKAAGALEDARKRSSEMREAFGKASDRTDEQKAKLAELSNEVGKLTRIWKAEVTEQGRVRASLFRLGASVREGTSATEQITHRSQQYNDQLSRQQSLLERVTKAQAAYDKTKALSGKLRGAGLKMGAAGGAALWGGMRLMQPGIDFDQAYSRTLADAQLDRNSAEGRALREQAKRLARTTHFSAIQATQGQDQLIAGGMTAANARTALPSILNMALAAHTDLGEAADIGSNVLDHFQLSADQAQRVSDVMVGTFTRSKTSLSSLNETLEYSGTLAHASGVSLETTAAAAAMLAKNGLTGTMAGTGLKEALSGLYAPSTAGAKALKALHIQTVTATGAVRPLADLMQELWNKTRKFDQASQFAAFQTIFGKEGMTAAQVLARSAAEGNLQAFAQYLENIKGASNKTAKTMTDNFAGDMQMLHSAWDGLWTQMEEGTDSPLRKVAQDLTVIIQGITDWTSRHPKLTAAIGDTALAVSGLTLAAGTLLTLVSGPIGLLALSRFALTMAGIGTAAEESLGKVTGLRNGLVALMRFGGQVTKGAIGELAPGAFFSTAGITASISAVGLAVGAAWDHLHLTDRLTSVVEHGNAATSTLAGMWLASTRDARVYIALLQRAIGLTDTLNLTADARHSLQAKVTALQGDIAGALLPDTLKAKADALKGDIAGALKPPKPEHGSLHFDFGGKKKKTKSAGDTASDTSSPNRLGDIVFKNLPAWVPLTGGYTQPRIVGASGSRLLPTPAKSSTAIGTNVAGDINLHFHIDGSQNMSSHQLAREVQHQVMDVLSKINRQKLASLKDRE